MHVLTQPLYHKQDTTQGHFLAEYSWFWIESFSSLWLVAQTRLNNLVNPTIYRYLEVGKTNGLIPFPTASEQSETQTTLSRVWTQVTDFISHDNNRYIESASEMFECIAINWIEEGFNLYI